MIKEVSQSDEQPLVLTPTSAEDFSRQENRRRWLIVGGIVAVLAVAGFAYKLWMDPIHARESFDAGKRLFAQARYDQAILSFDRAIALQSNFADAYYYRGRAHQAATQNDQALLDFSKVIALRPADPEGWIRRGAIYLDTNGFQAAVDDATHAIALNPNDATGYTLRATALRKEGDAKQALLDFDRAAQLAPSADAYFERGATYQLLGRQQEAVADFTRVIAIIPDLAAPFFARAESRRILGDLKGAEEDHQQGRVLDGR
jgi:tetratricopeptide (TPR) repeat protein